MGILMISLDQWIAEPFSRAAERMRLYGEDDDLFIIISSSRMRRGKISLSSTVTVWEIGGNKIKQFFRLLKLGKKIISEYDISLITTQDIFFTGLVGWLLKRNSKVKLEVQMHGDFFGGYYKKQWLRLCLAKFVLKRADVIRVVGERIRQSLIKLGVAESKIEVRPVFVDLEKIKNYQPKINLHEKYPGYEKIFLVLGRLDPVKNVSWLVCVFNEVVKQKNYLLLIVGGGREEKNYKLQITNYKLFDNIKFEPWTADPISYLKTADCLLFPSLSEGYGLVAVEAVAAGASVIMSDVGAANYELKSCPKVLIVPAGDRSKFIEAILRI